MLEFVPTPIIINSYKASTFLINEVLDTNLQFYFEILHMYLIQEEWCLPLKSFIQFNSSEINVVLKARYFLVFWQKL